MPPLLPRHTLPQAAFQKFLMRTLQEQGFTHERTAADQQIYDACRYDRALFAKTFLPDWCSDAFNTIHLDYYARLQAREATGMDRGRYDATAAPREHSKTTGCCMVSIVHTCVYELEPYTIYIARIPNDATGKIVAIRNQLEHNALLKRVYGPQMGTPWNNADFTTLHGQRVRGAGRYTTLRGTAHNAQRPTRVLLDDVEDVLHTLTDDQREKTWVWLTQDILHLGEPRTNYEVWGTILHPQSMLQTLMQTAGWQTHFYQAVIQFAAITSQSLWQEWRALFLDLGNPDREVAAQTFYDTHKQVMLQDVVELWPERKPYLALMQSRLRGGESSFWQELQNRPLGDERHLFHMDEAGYCTVQPNGNILRANGTLVPSTDLVDVAAYWDPVADKRDIRGTDFASCPLMVQDRAGYVYIIDAYIEQQTSTDAQIAAIVDMLWRWDCRVLGIEINGFQSLLPANVRTAVKARAHAEQTPEFDVQLVSVTNVRNKVLRIASLEPLVHNHWLQFSRTLPATFLTQFAEWLPIEHGGHDDALDSVEGGVRVLRHQFEKRDVT